MTNNRPSPLDAYTDPNFLATGVPKDMAAHYRTLGVWNGSTHNALLAQAVKRGGDELAATDRYRSLTWSELGSAVGEAAAILAARGVQRGDGVIIQMPNTVAYLEAVFAVWHLGAIPIFSLPAHGSQEILHFAAHGPALHYISTAKPNKHLKRVHRDIAERAESTASTDTADAANSELDVILVDESAEDRWAQLIDGDIPSTPPAATVPASELAFLQLSGGTTGVPKQIPKTHDDYLYSVRASLAVCDLNQGDVLLVALPAAHNFTMSSPGILGAIAVGAHIVYSPSPMPPDVLPLISTHGITHLALVPPALISLLNSSQTAETDTSSVRTVWVGGAKLSASAAERVKPELGWQLQQVFGMAEGLVNYTPLDASIEEITTTQGRPMSSYDEIRVVDDNDVEVPAGHEGHLLTRGPYTIRGYHRAPEVNARSFTEDGFYRTGDIVTFDHGSLTVVGRAKDQINRGGEKIAPEAVENVLLQHPGVHDVSVVGAKDDVLGERIQAFVIPRGGTGGVDKEQKLTSTAMKKFAREHGLSSFAVPDDVLVVDEFPFTGVGKVSKKDQRG